MNKGPSTEFRAEVQLAPMTSAHAQQTYQWLCDPLVSGNLGLRRTPSLEYTTQWISDAQSDPQISPFAILREGKHVGNAILDRFDDYLQSARLSIYIGELQQRGAGIGFMATFLALEYGFKQKGLHKIWLTVHARNFPAIHIYTKVGFKLEGILRDEFWLEKERVAALCMGLLHHEFDQTFVQRNSL